MMRRDKTLAAFESVILAKNEGNLEKQMASRDAIEDASFILYLVPLIASIIYGAYEWAIIPHSTTMPGLAYLIVSKSPYLFLLSVISVVCGLILEVRGTPLAERSAVIQANAGRMQVLAIAVLILSFFAAVSVGGYDLANGAAVFIAGRYALIFAFGLILWSFFLNPKQLIGNARLSSVVEIVGLFLLGAAPVVLYGGVKAHLDFDLSAVGAIIVAIIGAYLFFNNTKIFSRKPSQQAQPTVPAKQQMPQTTQA